MKFVIFCSAFVKLFGNRSRIEKQKSKFGKCCNTFSGKTFAEKFSKNDPRKQRKSNAKLHGLFAERGRIRTAEAED